MKLSKLLLWGLALTVLHTASAQADFKLTILHTNDVHSRVEPINQYDSGCAPQDDAEGKCFGGLARLKTAVDVRRNALIAAGRNVLLLDAGDQFQGSLFYQTYKGLFAAELMNRTGYDAMVVGNHEFDDGPETLGRFVDAVNFPVLFANTDLTNEPALKGKIVSHIVKEFADDKVAIIGLLTEDTAEISSPGPNVPFLSAKDTLNKLIPRLEADGVNKIIVLSHIGLERDKEIAANVRGIDIIVGGHSHTLLQDYPTVATAPDGKPVYIVQAYAHAKYLGELSVDWSDEGDVLKAEGQPWLLNGVVPADPAFAELIAEKAKPVEAIKSQVIGRTVAPIGRGQHNCRMGICEMGVLVADAMLDRVKEQGVEIAIQNGGGLRAAIDAGDVTMGEVLTVLPYQNSLSTFQLKGADIIAALENGVSQIEKGAGRFPQVAGLKYTFDPAAAPGKRISQVAVAQHGADFVPLDPEMTYGVVSNNYMRSGGDGYKVLQERALNAYDYGPGLEVVVADYLARVGPYKPYTDDRIQSK